MSKLFLLFLVCTLCISFSVAANIQTSYNKSLKAWKNLKACTYNYQTSAYPLNIMIAGYHDYTKIKVVDNKVVRREYRAWTEDIDGSGNNVVVLESFVESKPSQIGTHPNSGASDAITIDEVYAQCKELLKEDPAENILVFNVDNKGLIRQCGFSPINCADGCFRGFNIDFINVTKKNLRR